MANPTIAEIFAAYFDDAEAREIASPASIKSHAKHMLVHFGAMPIDAFNAGAKARMLKYAKHRREIDGVGDSTINREVRNLKAALNFAEREEFIDRAQNKWLPKPRANDPRERTLSHEEGGEIDRVMAALADKATPAHIQTFVPLALMTGQRKSAILQLRREHIVIYPEPKAVKGGARTFGEIRFAKTQKRKTKKKRQDQPIHEALLPVIEAALARMSPGCDHLIQWRGRPVKDVRAGYQALLKRAGVAHATVHDLRRTAAQTVRDQTDDLGQAARFIGDTEATTGSTYARARVEQNLPAMNEMAKVLRRAGAPARSSV